MKIYIQIGKQEQGPYSKSEVFALLKNGSISSEALGRWENETEWKPINQVLASGTLGLFSVEQIAQKQEELPEAPVLISDFVPARSETTSESGVQTSKSKKPFILAALALLLAACSVGTLVLVLRQSEMQQVQTVNVTPMPRDNEIHSQQTQEHASATPRTSIARSAPKQAVSAVSSPTPQEALALTKDPSATSVAQVQSPSPTETGFSFFGKRGGASSIQPPSAVVEATPAPTPISTPAAITKVQEKTLEVAFPKIPGLKGANVNITQFGDDPRGILVIYLDHADRSNLVFVDEEWKDFAKNNDLLLTVAKFDFTTNQAIENIQKALIQKLEPWKNLPILAYGRHSGGWIASSIANINEQRIASWAVFTNGHLMPQIAKDPRPALLICDYESTKDNHDLRKFFEDGRTLGKPWTWLSLANPVDQRQAKAEEFVRSYFEALISRQEPGKHAWADIDDLNALPDAYAMGYPRTTTWLPSSELLATWKSLMPTPQQKADPVIIRKRVRTNCKAQPELELVLRLPPGASKDHPPAGTFAFCTWDASADQIAEKLRYKPDLKSVARGGPVWVANNIVKYADDHNFAVLSWETRQIWSLKGSTEDLSKKEQREFDMNFDKLAAAWETGVKLLESSYQMPSKDMLLYGISRGAQWAHRLAMRKPEYFLAVHVHIPSTFDAPTAKANSLLWLVTTGEQEGGYEQAIRFYTECRKLGYPMLFKAIIGVGHSDDPLAWNLDHRFFDYALELRDERRKVIKDQSLNMLSTASLSQSWLKTYFHSPYVADLLNQEVFPASEMEMVPPALRVPIPTQQMAEAWESDARKELLAK